jgi:hypothetical protein
MGASQWTSGARATLAAGAAAALVACAVGPGSVQYESEGNVLTTPDGLHRVKNWRFGGVYVKPGADLARYDSVVIGDVSIVYKRPRTPAHASRDGVERGTYLLSPRAENSFKRYLQKALASEFDKSDGLVVTQRPTSNAIRVNSHILDLVVRTSPNWSVANAMTTFVANRGEFTLILDLRDAQSGAPLLRVGSRSAIKFDGARAYIPAGSVSSAAIARGIFRKAAVRLRRQLDEYRALSGLPPAPTLAPQGS